MNDINKQTQDQEQFVELLTKVYNKLLSEQVPLEPEFQEVIDKNLWELLEKT